MAKMPAFLQSNTVAKAKKKKKKKGNPFAKSADKIEDKADAETGLVSRKPFANKGY